MRRVVVTGIGIVSSIGTNKAEVLASLRAGRSGIEFSEEYKTLGFRSQVHGPVRVKPEESIDRKLLRFMGDAAAFSYLAMTQAIADAGLTEDVVSNERTGLIVGSGGASPKNQVEAADLLRDEGREARRAVHGAARDVEHHFGLPRDPVPHQGRQLLDQLGLLHQRALHRQCVRTDPDGQAGHHLRRRRRRSAPLPDRAVRRDGRPVVQVQRHADQGIARLRRRRATAS